jgi:hypothetical protein
VVLDTSGGVRRSFERRTDACNGMEQSGGCTLVMSRHSELQGSTTTPEELVEGQGKTPSHPKPTLARTPNALHKGSDGSSRKQEASAHSFRHSMATVFVHMRI